MCAMLLMLSIYLMYYAILFFETLSKSLSASSLPVLVQYVPVVFVRYTVSHSHSHSRFAAAHTMKFGFICPPALFHGSHMLVLLLLGLRLFSLLDRVDRGEVVMEYDGRRFLP